MRELRRIASQGIPDGAGIRSTVWKVGLHGNFLFIGYYPFLTACFLFCCKEVGKKRSYFSSS